MGKVGLPAALALAVHGGHDVTGYDTSTWPSRVLAGEVPLPQEKGIDGLLAMDHGIDMADSPAGLVHCSDLVIVAVPTPHPPGYGGEVPVTQPVPADFIYSYLTRAVKDICQAAGLLQKKVTVSVLSTVLPGTMRREILPLGNEYVTFLYAPSFIALGTVIMDFAWPGFSICGAENPGDAKPLEQAYRAFLPEDPPPFYVMSTESAEVAKMAYNFAGTVRIELANWLQRLSSATGADCDDVTQILDFLPHGIRPGMPDGGPCRPRDLIALRMLSDRTGVIPQLPYIFQVSREEHARWLAAQVRDEAVKRGLPVMLMGTEYKEGTGITGGSPSLLLKYFLDERYPDGCLEYKGEMPDHPAVYVASVQYDLSGMKFPEGSVIFDPWGTVQRDDIDVIRPGRL